MHYPTGINEKKGMRMLRHKRLSAAIATAGTLVGLMSVVPATTASAATTWSTHICQGSLHRPGHLLGNYWNVVVRGVCVVDRGPVFVQRNVWVGREGVLLAAFARHNSRLVVGRNVFVEKNGTLLLGCEAKHFACLDDSQKHPRLNSHSTIFGSLLGDRALGIVVHNSAIEHSVSQISGGGGTTCKPHGVFKAFKSPVYSDYEDNFIRGDLHVTGLHTCWFGTIRNFVASSARIGSSRLADPDGNEIVSNVVLLNLLCFNNSPKAQFGDSHGKPNRVGRHALGECGFRVLKANPAGQHKHFEHISVPLHR
jgi:hypothetical protein